MFASQLLEVASEAELEQVLQDLSIKARRGVEPVAPTSEPVPVASCPATPAPVPVPTSATARPVPACASPAPAAGTAEPVPSPTRQR